MRIPLKSRWERRRGPSTPVCLYLVAFCAALLAQGTGTIVGSLTDQAGAAVSGAVVSIENVDTGIKHEALTDGTGIYTQPHLPVGNYRITVSQTGFKKAVVEGVRLQVGATFRADVGLEVGEVATSVSVAATSPLLQSETSDVSTVIERKRIVDLPLNGRDFQQLQLLTPGAVNTMNHQTTAGLSGGASGVATNDTMIVSNGSRPGSQLFLVDGAYNSNRQGRTIVVTPSIDEIEEFRVAGSNFSAEVGYGTNMVSVATRSGTNEFHGTAWNFLRNNAVVARNFFQLTPPVLKKNQFGGLLAGPVVRNRTFFLMSYEGMRERTSRPWLTTVPTAAQRTGDLSDLSPIFDPLTSRYTASGAIERDRFPNNRIPQSRISPVSALFLEWYPQPNRPGLSGNFLNEPPFGTQFDQFNVRMDHRFSEKDNLMGRITRRMTHTPQQGPYEGHSKNDYNPGVVGIQANSTNAVVAWTHIFNPTTTLEIRPSYTRPSIDQFSGPNIDRDWTSEAGIQGFGPGVSDVYPTWPEMNIAGFSPIYSYIGFQVLHNSRDLVGALTMIRGRHQIKIGNTFASYQQLIHPSGVGQGSFSFTGIYSSNPAGGGVSGAGLADYLLGLPASGGRYVPPGVYYIQLRNNWSYIQDDWKVNQRLTLNLGLRYELNFPTTEKYDQLATWDPSPRGGRGAIVVPNVEAVTGDRGNLHSSVGRSLPTYSPLIVYAKDLGLPERSMRFLNKKQFAPRAGFAYRMMSNFVVRGGYGIFYNQLDGNRETEFLSPPFLIRESGILNEFTPNGAPARTTQTLFPAGSTFSPKPVILGHDPWARDFGYTQQWNLFLQKLLPGQLAVEVGYVGNKGTRLQNGRQYNAPLPGPGNIDARRPFQDFLGITWSEQTASSIYHAMQAKVERRYMNGFTLMSSFTWSKSIDNASVSSSGCVDPRNCRAERSVSQFDVPFSFVTSAVYDLPFLRNASSWPVRTFIGGWTLSGILTLQSGYPFTPGWSGDVPNTGQGTRPNRTCGGEVDNPTIDRWFDASCFTSPAVYTYGNSGRNILRGDGIQNIDLGIYKDFAIREGHRLTFRSEFFNAFNHPNFGLPAATVNATNTVGRVTTAGPARIVQFALKYNF